MGFHCLGFEDVEFTGTPDFIAAFKLKKFLIEVTRLGASPGKRADVWDEKYGSLEEGWKVGAILEGEKATKALWDAIYDEVESKYVQLRKSAIQADGWIVWISPKR